MKRVKKTLKYIFIICLGFIVFTQIIDLIGWLSDEEPVDKSVLIQVQKITPAENGYNVIKFMDEPEFHLLQKGCNSAVLSKLLTDKQWDDETAQSVLNDHLKYRGLILQVNTKQYFQSRIIQSYLDDFPSYSDYGNLLKLKLLESRSYAENQDIDQAIKAAEQALIFSQRIKDDRSSTLISFLVGMAHQDQAISWIHRLGTHYNISNSQRKKLLDSTQAVSDFKNDNFDAVISGEFYYVESFINQTSNMATLDGRKNLLLMILQKQEEDRTGFTLIENLFSLFSPHFVLQKEKTKNAMYDYRKKDITFVRNSCEQVDYSYYNEGPYTEGLNLLKLNSIGSSLIETVPSLQTYFLRRCQADFHLQAVRTAIAITQYESINNRKIQHLQELVPSIIETLPTDATTNETLSFNAEQRWVYSKGSNFFDDQGSLKTIYNSTCHRNNLCKNNPTVPIVNMAATPYIYE